MTIALPKVPPSPLRLRVDADALAANWRELARMSAPAACGAAVKANGYGLGATRVAQTLGAAGCRDFFVATWAEAIDLAPLGLNLAVLHGVFDEDMPAALALSHAGLVRPVLNSLEQTARWRSAGGGECHVMVDTGMNRLGVAPGDIGAGALAGLTVDILMSHLACADEDVSMNARQRDSFAALKERTNARRMSLANSAGIALGTDYAFDLTRPGLALYGGVPRAELAHMRQVAVPEARVIQRRTVRAGESIGYGATYVAASDLDVAILHIGYADGYFRGFSNRGRALAGDDPLPVLGRVSMDLTAVDVTGAEVTDGDWLAIDFALPQAAAASGLSQYELLTGLGRRF